MAADLIAEARLQERVRELARQIPADCAEAVRVGVLKGPARHRGARTREG